MGSKDEHGLHLSLAFEPFIAQDNPIERSRLDRLVSIVDSCTAAKHTAEALGDPFLVYMLSMTIQAVHTEMRPKALRANR